MYGLLHACVYVQVSMYPSIQKKKVHGPDDPRRERLRTFELRSAGPARGRMYELYVSATRSSSGVVAKAVITTLARSCKLSS
jgi:hypothetical protein